MTKFETATPRSTSHQFGRVLDELLYAWQLVYTTNDTQKYQCQRNAAGII